MASRRRVTDGDEVKHLQPPVASRQVKRILVFCPENVGPHLHLMDWLGYTFSRFGHQVTFIRCENAQPRCVFKDSMHGTETRFSQTLCMQCHQRFGDTWGRNFANVVTLNRQYLTQSKRILCTYPNGRVPASLLNRETKYRSFPLGDISIAQFMLISKSIPDSERFDDDTHSALSEIFINNLFLHLSFIKIFEAQKFDAVITFDKYGQNFSVGLTAESLGVNYVIANQSCGYYEDRQRFYMEKPRSFSDKADLERLRFLSDYPGPSQRAVDLSIRTIESNFGGRSIYNYSSPTGATKSEKFDRLRTFSSTRKVLVFFTSSLDEFECSRIHDQILGSQSSETSVPMSIFENQLELILWLIRKGEVAKDSHYVIRIHPREASTGRSNVESSHLRQLRSALSNIEYPNVTIFWPEESVSSYDLFPLIDLGLVSWSSIGLEMTRLGIPCVSPWYVNPTYNNWCPCVDLISNSYDFECAVTDIDEYACKGNQQAVFSRMYYSLAKMDFKHFHTTLDISDVVPTAKYHGQYSYSPSRSSNQIVSCLHGILEGKPVKEEPSTVFERPAEFHQSSNREIIANYIERLVPVLSNSFGRETKIHERLSSLMIELSRSRP